MNVELWKELTPIQRKWLTYEAALRFGEPNITLATLPFLNDNKMRILASVLKFIWRENEAGGAVYKLLKYYNGKR